MTVRGTTPTITLAFSADDVDFTETAHVYVTFTNNFRKLTKKDEELSIGSSTIGVPLSQRDTLLMKKGVTEIQVNWTYADGSRGASEIAEEKMSKNLLNEVLE